MRRYYLASAEKRGIVDLREYQDEIVEAVHQIMPQAQVEVTKDFYSVLPSPPKGFAIKIGKLLSSKDVLGGYCIKIGSLYLSAEVSRSIDAEASYIRNKGFNDQYYRDLIVQYLKQYGKARKKELRDLLWDKLPDVLDDKKKNSKISTLLTSLRVKGIITTDSPNQQKSYWVLVGNGNNSNKKV